MRFPADIWAKVVLLNVGSANFQQAFIFENSSRDHYHNELVLEYEEILWIDQRYPTSFFQLQKHQWSRETLKEGTFERLIFSINVILIHRRNFRALCRRCWDLYCYETGTVATHSSNRLILKWRLKIKNNKY